MLVVGNAATKSRNWAPAAGHNPSFVSLPDSRRSIYQAGAHVAIVTHS